MIGTPNQETGVRSRTAVWVKRWFIWNRNIVRYKPQEETTSAHTVLVRFLCGLYIPLFWFLLGLTRHWHGRWIQRIAKCSYSCRHIQRPWHPSKNVTSFWVWLLLEPVHTEFHPTNYRAFVFSPRLSQWESCGWTSPKDCGCVCVRRRSPVYASLTNRGQIHHRVTKVRPEGKVFIIRIPRFTKWGKKKHVVKHCCRHVPFYRFTVLPCTIDRVIYEHK